MPRPPAGVALAGKAIDARFAVASALVLGGIATVVLKSRRTPRPIAAD